MGKVFSWAEIAQGQVPRLESFPVVARQIRHDLEAIDGVIGGILCGSVLWNRGTRRSDIDCFVLYEPERQRQVLEALRGIERQAADFHVPVGLIPLDRQLAATAFHHLDGLFVVHLRRAAAIGGIIKADPLPFLALDARSMTDEVRDYFRHKLRKFETRLISLPTMDEATRYRFLQKVLETPIHVARKMLHLRKVKQADDLKQTVSRCYAEIASSREFELFTKVNEADRQYTAELSAQLQHPDRIRYGQVIKAIEDLAWDTLEFVRVNALLLA